MNTLDGKSIAQVIKEYRELRSILEAKRKAFKQFEADTKDDMDQMSMWLKDRATELGVTSLPTVEGTAYRSTKSYARVADWELLAKHLLKTGNIHLLEKRIAKLAFIEYMEEKNRELNGQFAPEDIGVAYSEEIEFLVRSPDK